MTSDVKKTLVDEHYIETLLKEYANETHKQSELAIRKSEERAKECARRAQEYKKLRAVTVLRIKKEQERIDLHKKQIAALIKLQKRTEGIIDSQGRLISEVRSLMSSVIDTARDAYHNQSSATSELAVVIGLIFQGIRSSLDKDTRTLIQSQIDTIREGIKRGDVRMTQSSFSSARDFSVGEDLKVEGGMDVNEIGRDLNIGRDVNET